MDRFQKRATTGFPFYYWFIAGLIVGVVLGWSFHGVVTWIFRGLVIAGLVVVIYLFYKYWRRGQSAGKSSAEDIPEASWRDIDSTRRR
jgi:hypothetical protein